MNKVNTIGIDDLRFFTGEGKEILMNKQYSARWEILPADYVYSSFIKNPQGHFELPLPADLTDLWESAGADEIAGGYIRTESIKLQPNRRYEITVSGMSGKQVILFTSDTGKKVGTLSAKTDNVTIKLLCNSQGLLEIIESDDYEYSEFAWRLCKKFRVIALADDTTKNITEYVNTVDIVVDEPGQIRPEVTFTRSAHDADYIFDYRLVDSMNGVVQLTDKDSCYRRLDEDGLTVHLDNIFDIVFFGYKTVIDDEADYETNTLLLTLNDGNEIITQEYNLLDFLLTSKDIANIENLPKYHTWNGSADMFIENIGDIDVIAEEAGYIYGISSDIFAERLMVDYDQWDEKLFEDLRKVILRCHRDQYKMTDNECLKIIYSFFRDREYSLEYWNNEEILAIVRPRNE